MPTGAGTPGLDGWTPPVDAAVVATLREAGATFTGKLALHELSTGVTSNNAHTGPVSNPYRLDHHTGGSSGGTAAAVAAGLIPVGLGGDTGGSCRIPAALCGCVGFRPTLGRWSQAGCVPISSTRDTPGPLGRSVQDVRMLDAVVTATRPRRRGRWRGCASACRAIPSTSAWSLPSRRSRRRRSTCSRRRARCSSRSISRRCRTSTGARGC